MIFGGNIDVQFCKQSMSIVLVANVFGVITLVRKRFNWVLMDFFKCTPMHNLNNLSILMFKV